MIAIYHQPLLRAWRHYLRALLAGKHATLRRRQTMGRNTWELIIHLR